MRKIIGKEQSIIDLDLHRLFDLGVFLKGVEGVLEIIGSIGLFLFRNRLVEKTIRYITQGELTEHPQDHLTKAVIYVFQHVTAGSVHFVAAVLLISGVVNLVLVFGIMKKDVWAYRGAMMVLSLLILYQTYRVFYHGSSFLIASIVYDAIIVLLVAREYAKLTKTTSA